MGGVNLDARREVVAAITMCDEAQQRLSHQLAKMKTPSGPAEVSKWVRDTMRGEALDLAIREGIRDPIRAAERGTAYHAVMLENCFTALVNVVTAEVKVLRAQAKMLRALIEDTDKTGTVH